MLVLLFVAVASAWEPVPVGDDPLVHMPGTQHGEGPELAGAEQCTGCHGGYDAAVEPVATWQGSMMGQAARDPLFWAALAVAAQDSLWAFGRPNAADLCLRCHLPGGWAAGRSEPPNGSAMAGVDFEGVSCAACHAMVDPFAVDRAAEGDATYWDETDASATPSSEAAATALTDDLAVLGDLTWFDGTAFLDGTDRPAHAGWTEATSGQFVLADDGIRRGPYADAQSFHPTGYSRFHKSPAFCGTCHDVSNPALVNDDHAGARPGDPVTLPTEQAPAAAWAHVERTYSEFRLSAYGRGGGAEGSGAFADLATHDGRIARCQDCHMRDRPGTAASFSAPTRPDDSVEHPHTGIATHELTGANAWVPWILASTVEGSPNFDAGNRDLLDDPATLTLDLDAGLPLDPGALLAGVERAKRNLADAATIEDLAVADGAVSFRVVNHTGHKLPTGYPEGRRVFVTVQAFRDGAQVWAANAWTPEEGLADPDGALIYEMLPTSELTGETHSLHFVLSTGRYKDNRIPPRGFAVDEAAERLAEPVWEGASTPGLFTAEEYAGGYDAVTVDLPVVADAVEVSLHYQTVTRDYIDFLAAELAGGGTLTEPGPSGERAYVAATDPWFEGLRGWATVLPALYERNRDVPGAAPVEMAQARIEGLATDTGDTGPADTGAPGGCGCGGGGVPGIGGLLLVGLLVSRRCQGSQGRSARSAPPDQTG